MVFTGVVRVSRMPNYSIAPCRALKSWRSLPEPA
jgi:hypothetical protein